MNRSTRAAAIAVAAISTFALSQPALADGDVVCSGGPQENWQAQSEVGKKAWQQGWEVLRIQVEGDCYEVYARNAQGQAIEAFFHPVTLEKLVVFRRGREIFRKRGFTG